MGKHGSVAAEVYRERAGRRGEGRQRPQFFQEREGGG